MTRFLITPNDTVLNYYLLPLVGVNKESFGDNFIRTLITKDGKYAYILVNHKTAAFTSCDNFIGLHSIGDLNYVIFQVPDKYLIDTQLLVESKYSKMSGAAKDLIRNHSGLYYNFQCKDGYITSKAILALDKHPSMVTFYTNVLGLTPNQANNLIINPEIELMSRLEEADFIENYLVTQKESV